MLKTYLPSKDPFTGCYIIIISFAGGWGRVVWGEVNVIQHKTEGEGQSTRTYWVLENFGRGNLSLFSSYGRCDVQLNRCLIILKMEISDNKVVFSAIYAYLKL